MADELNYEIIKDLGGFGEGKWQKHLTIINWNNKGEKYDIRPWNEDMSKMGKGITLTKEDLYDLSILIENELGLSDEEYDVTTDNYGEDEEYNEDEENKADEFE